MHTLAIFLGLYASIGAAYYVIEFKPNLRVMVEAAEAAAESRAGRLEFLAPENRAAFGMLVLTFLVTNAVDAAIWPYNVYRLLRFGRPEKQLGRITKEAEDPLEAEDLPQFLPHPPRWRVTCACKLELEGTDDHDVVKCPCGRFWWAPTEAEPDIIHPEDRLLVAFPAVEVPTDIR